MPVRLTRLGRHLYLGIRWKHYFQSTPDRQVRSRSLTKVMHFWLEALIYLVECFGIGETYETLMDLVKWKTRPLTAREIQMAKTIFGDKVCYKRVRIDEYATIGPRQKRFCYVSFYIINSWGKMSDSTLIHELTHIWQYEQIGAVYMPRAIRAQYTIAGYNYGGVTSLLAYLQKDQDMLAFNLEQQADIVKDYFRIQNGWTPSWGNGKQGDLLVYEKTLKPLFDKNTREA